VPDAGSRGTAEDSLLARRGCKIGLDAGEQGARLMAQMTVKVYGEDCSITVYQKSKTVWVATGVFMGSSLLVKGSSENVATRKWVHTAEIRARR
jgi:hypothetical protein